MSTETAPPEIAPPEIAAPEMSPAQSALPETAPPPPPPSAEERDVVEGTMPSPPAVPALVLPGEEELPKIGALLNQTIDGVKLDFASWLLSGLGMLVSVMISIALVLGVYIGGVFVWMAVAVAGAVAFGDAGAALGNLVGLLLWIALIFGTIVLAGVISAPINVSIGRAVLGHLRDGKPLGPADGFSTLTQDLVSVVLVSLMSLTLVMIGLPFFYIGAFVASYFTHFALPAVVVHRLGPIAAMQRSFQGALANPGYHLSVWGLGIVISMVAGNIPFIGVMIGVPIWWALTLRGYVAVYGDGSELAEA